MFYYYEEQIVFLSIITCVTRMWSACCEKKVRTVYKNFNKKLEKKPKTVTRMQYYTKVGQETENCTKNMVLYKSWKIIKKTLLEI